MDTKIHWDYALSIVEDRDSQILFHKEPETENGLFGKQYLLLNALKTVVDRTEEFYPTVNPKNGYCIRTGSPIPFNPDRPFSRDAFVKWNEFKNPEYPEKYCHQTGKPSAGKTSMANPILNFQ